MLHSENHSEMSVLERQRSRLKWQQEQLIQHQPITFFNENVQLGSAFPGFNTDQGGFGEFLTSGAMKPDPGFETGLNDDFRSVLSYGNGPSELEAGSYAIPRTVSCQPPPPAAATSLAQNSSGAAPTEGSKKRKADKTQNLKVTGAEKAEEKKMKGCKAEESKNTEQNSSSKSTTTSVTNNKNTKGTSANNTKENNNKTSEYPKPDYIHVRARRGQATDSHSLAERVRREKISERMKFLQDLVPGCNKITGKAGMLDEIINYVQSLQRQVEFLSMKLAVINPRLDFDEDSYQVKEMYNPGCTSSDMVNHASLQFNTLEQGVSNSSLEMLTNPMDSTLRRTISAPVSIPQAFLDSSILNQIQQLTWEDEIQNLYSMEYQQEQSASFISQPFTGLLETGHVKLEM